MAATAEKLDPEVKVKRGKRYAATFAKIRAVLADRQVATTSLKAFELIASSTAKAKHDESVAVAYRLGVDPKQADQMVRGAVTLPHGLGKTAKVIVFAKGEKAREAEAAGADAVGAEDLVEKINGGWTDFTSVVATPDMMGVVSKLGKVLGPKGLMPNPKTGTVTFDLTKAVTELKKGRAEFRVEKAGIVHASVGKLSFGAQKLHENFMALTDQIVKQKPQATKGNYLVSIYVASSMGPSIRIGTDEFLTTTKE